MNPEAALIEARGVGKSYRRGRQELTVLSGLDLAVRGGEFLSLMGPSGSGKTTLLNLLGGLDTPSTGEIRCAGRAITDLSSRQLAAWRSEHVGFIFQFYNLIPVLTAFQNVALPLLLTPLSRRERKEHVATALGIVGLGERADHYPSELSGGEEQRVAIARAVVTDPTFLLADEPTGDLDEENADAIMDLLVRLNEEYGKTIVLVTHDPRAAARAGRRVRLHKGKLVDSGEEEGGGSEEEAPPAPSPEADA